MSSTICVYVVMALFTSAQYGDVVSTRTNESVYGAIIVVPEI